MKKLIVAVLAICVFCAGCGANKKYSTEIYGSFDTVTTLTAYSANEGEFDELARICEERLMDYSKLYDIYLDYDGVSGIFEINQSAGSAVKVDPAVIDLINFGLEWHEKSGGRVNIAMGEVLKIWHDWRENGGDLPNQAELLAAAEHCDIGNILVDEAASTVTLSDKEMSLDVGAIAKGFAVERVTQELTALGYSDFIISAGGNVRSSGAPAGRKTWSVGIESPDAAGELIETVDIADEAVVTSGGYLRFREIDGKKYHHIIDTQTLMPAQKVKSATIIYKDSGVADACSTAAFLMEPAQIGEFVKTIDGMRAIILDMDNKIWYY